MSRIESQPKRVDLDRSLVAARNGSLSALGKLLEHYRGYLWTVAHNALDSGLLPKVAPSDLVQETLMQAVQDFPKFAGSTEEELRAWLRQVLLHNGQDAYRRFRGAEKRDLNREVPLQNGFSSANKPQQLVANDPHPTALLAADEEQLLLRQVLAGLSPEYRQVIELRSLEGLGFDEVGRRMNRSADAARKLWSRAVERLADELNCHGSQ